MEVTSLAARTFAAILEERTGQQLTGGRRWRIETALQPILRVHGLPNLDALAFATMRGADPDAQALRISVAEALLNHETSFFRDRATFDGLSQQVLPHLADRRADCRRLRIWSAGCSTGQEAYSLAMILDRAGARWRDWSIEVVATDVSHAAVARAREGVYHQREIERGLPIADLSRYMTPEGDQWRVRPEIAARVRFRVANLLDPPPPGPFDLILCRNVLLYFGEERRRQVFDRLAEALAADGVLLLGAGETAFGQTDTVCAAPGLRGCYVRSAAAEGTGAIPGGGAMPGPA